MTAMGLTGLNLPYGEALTRFSQEELAEFAREVEELQQRWRDRTKGRDDGRTTYSVYQLIQPYPDLLETADDTPDPVHGDVRVIGFGHRPDADAPDTAEEG